MFNMQERHKPYLSKQIADQTQLADIVYKWYTNQARRIQLSNREAKQ